MAKRGIGLGISLGYELHEYGELSYLGAASSDGAINDAVASIELAF